MQLSKHPLRAALLSGVLALGAGLSPVPLRAESPPSDRTVLMAQRLVQRNPLDARAYYRLGDAYIQKARETGDTTYVNLAERALRRALTLYPRYADAARHLGFVLYSRHDFEGARLEATKAVDLNPDDSHAHGILGDAFLEIGRYEEAGQAYQRMIALRADLYSYSRLAGLQSLRGETGAALRHLERAIEAGQADQAPRESIAWAQWQLGCDYFGLGNLNRGESAYTAALNTFPGYYRAIAGLAAVRAAQQRYDEAVGFYRQALGIIPLPEYATALGDIHTKLGRPNEARKQYDLVEYIGRLNSLNAVLYNRDLALFYADHDMNLGEALALARQELTARQDIYAYDVLAWALYKNVRLDEARLAIREALKLGTPDARLFFHAGMIHLALGERSTGRAYLKQAVATNPYFHVLHADVVTGTLRTLR